ncbi:hypothetical protein [Cognatiyoonia sp. IB215182]|uniref:hypothetical protein n=1 Tax=Cognatiyoonia sp. IB215182 TaxID=3097353 RepID=UPI002A0DCBC8|nr:hypothetical protein [Cognatiyoonia sp. IB215182]MDX8350863.1 hypothetical protein [Cognatiyoonia sp. IB215182]
MTKLPELSPGSQPVARVPTLDHEFGQSGLRVIALPPGKAEVHYQTEFTSRTSTSAKSQ